MEFELRHFDTPLLRFIANPQSVDTDYSISWINETQKHLLPHGLMVSSEGIASWISHRTIPKNRAFVNTFLARNGLNSNRPLAIMALCKGLSLTDCYWVVEASSEETFSKLNLYDNRMSRLLAEIAFTGYGSRVRSRFSSSPEFTTNGMLPKCWRRIDGKIVLYKGGTTGFANAGFEPFSEYYAADVAQVLKVNHVDYELHTWKGTLCSTCNLFTSKKYSYVPAAHVIPRGGFQAVEQYYLSKGSEFIQAFSDMLAFDALICNTDRHMNNFGFIADAVTNEIIRPAPLFDQGNSLFYQAFGDDWSSVEALCEYADTQDACMYGDFFTVAKKHMTAETRKKVRSVLSFQFSRRPLKGFSAKRLALIEKMIQLRAQRLLQ